MTFPFDDMEDNYCWVTNQLIPVGAPCRFTFEWDAWVSEEGQKRVWACKESDWELELIQNEWLTEEALFADSIEHLYDDPIDNSWTFPFLAQEDDSF